MPQADSPVAAELAQLERRQEAILTRLAELRGRVEEATRQRRASSDSRQTSAAGDTTGSQPTHQVSGSVHWASARSGSCVIELGRDSNRSNHTPLYTSDVQVLQVNRGLWSIQWLQ